MSLNLICVVAPRDYIQVMQLFAGILQEWCWVLPQGLIFLSRVQVKYFVVQNPSSLPVSLQLLPLSLYPKPAAAVRLLHKW